MDSLRNALETICALSNVYLQNLDQRGDAWVVLTSLVDHDGTVNVSARDKIVMTVFNIRRETTVSSYQAAAPAPAGSGGVLPVLSPPLYLDVHLMFMANFAEKSYADGLAALSRLIGFFQQNPFFNAQTAPALDPAIGKLTLDLESMSPVDVNYVMSMLGVRYLPSAFYKLRMIPFASSAMRARSHAVTGEGLAGATAA